MSFHGIHRSPSLASEGAADYLINLMPHDGELRNIPSTEQLDIRLEEGDVLMCVHHISQAAESDRSHYIVANATDLEWIDAEGARTLITRLDNPPSRVTPMGNVLVITTPSATAYALWQDQAYTYLGDTFPQLDIQFRLDTKYVQTFKKGAETGITIQKAGYFVTEDFSEAVAPTPVATPQFSGDYTFEITPAASLTPATTYKLLCRRLTGKVRQWLRVFLVYTDGSEELAGEGMGDLLDEHDICQPYAVFTTHATKSVAKIRLQFSPSNSGKTVSYTVVLLKGGAQADGMAFADTPENFNALMAVANDFIDRQATRQNRFIYPFFVRYALRLYDGSYVCPSAPCLMLPNVGIAPHVWALRPPTDGSPCDTIVSAVAAQLCFRLTGSADLAGWSRLVSGIAFAVSSPVWSYNQGAEWSAGEGLVTLGHGTLSDEAVSDEADTWSYGYFDDGDGTCSSTYLFRKNNGLSQSDTTYKIHLPKFSARQVADELKSRSVFYIIAVR